MDSIEAKKIVANVVSIAREAGQDVKNAFYQPRSQETKSSSVDLVTPADKMAEKYIFGELLERYPNYNIIGEEGNAHDAASNYQWVIDPIDGTTNFAHRIPHFAICISLVDREAFPPILGVVYDPMRDEVFSAVRGNGALLNLRIPLKVSDTNRLSQAVVASGFPYDKWSNPVNNTDHWSNFVVRSRGIRRFGAAALDAAYVASGRFDGYWEHNVKPWDVSASLLFVTEAGGKFSNYENNPLLFDKTGMRVVVTNGHIHDEVIRVLQEKDKAPRPSD